MARTVIDPASIAAEKGAVITELHSYENDPASVLQEAVTRTAIQAHPYGSPMAGYVSDVAGLTAERRARLLCEPLAPGNAVLAIAGDFVPRRPESAGCRDFADVPARPVATPSPDRRAAAERRAPNAIAGPVDRQYFQLALPFPGGVQPATFRLFSSSRRFCPADPASISGKAIGPARRRSKGRCCSVQRTISRPGCRRPTIRFCSRSAARSRRRRVPTGSNATSSGGLPRSATARPLQPRLAKRKRRSFVRSPRTCRPPRMPLTNSPFSRASARSIVLLDLPRPIAAVIAADMQRVARTYLVPDKLTVGWMVPGKRHRRAVGQGSPRPAADRPGAAPTTGPARSAATPASFRRAARDRSTESAVEHGDGGAAALGCQGGGRASGGIAGPRRGDPLRNVRMTSPRWSTEVVTAVASVERSPKRPATTR